TPRTAECCWTCSVSCRTRTTFRQLRAEPVASRSRRRGRAAGGISGAHAGLGGETRGRRARAHRLCEHKVGAVTSCDVVDHSFVDHAVHERELAREPRMPQQRRARVTRGAILLAAAEEFERIGYSGATLGAVLRRSGVTKGAFYFHFD